MSYAKLDPVFLFSRAQAFMVAYLYSLLFYIMFVLFLFNMISLKSKTVCGTCLYKHSKIRSGHTVILHQYWRKTPYASAGWLPRLQPARSANVSKPEHFRFGNEIVVFTFRLVMKCTWKMFCFSFTSNLNWTCSHWCIVRIHVLATGWLSLYISRVFHSKYSSEIRTLWKFLTTVKNYPSSII